MQDELTYQCSVCESDWGANEGDAADCCATAKAALQKARADPALAAAQAEVARLREALEWALREIDGDNIYRRGDQQIAAHDRARAVLESPKP
jgi:hypothetical protein